MRLLVLLFAIVFQSTILLGQDGFYFKKNKSKDRISFELINNLILIPVEVNGVKLSFLLDSGAANTIIFSFEERDSLLLNSARKIRLRGLGADNPVDGIISENNRLKIGKAFKDSQTVYVVFDGSLRLSSRLGVPVHGIIGNDFFKILLSISIMQPKIFVSIHLSRTQKMYVISVRKRNWFFIETSLILLQKLKLNLLLKRRLSCY